MTFQLGKEKATITGLGQNISLTTSIIFLDYNTLLINRSMGVLSQILHKSTHASQYNFINITKLKSVVSEIF